MKLILQIAIGVCLGVVLGGALLMQSTGMLSTQLLNEALKPSVTPPSTTEPKASIDELLAKATASPENNTPVIAKPVDPKPNAPQANSPTTPAPVAEIRLAGKKAPTEPITAADSDEKKQKDARFRAYYQKSEKCLSPSDNETRVACGNEYIRAKAKFEELYQQEKSKN